MLTRHTVSTNYIPTDFGKQFKKPRKGPATQGNAATSSTGKQVPQLKGKGRAKADGKARSKDQAKGVAKGMDGHGGGSRPRLKLDPSIEVLFPPPSSDSDSDSDDVRELLRSKRSKPIELDDSEDEVADGQSQREDAHAKRKTRKTRKPRKRCRTSSSHRDQAALSDSSDGGETATYSAYILIEPTLPGPPTKTPMSCFCGKPPPPLPPSKPKQRGPFDFDEHVSWPSFLSKLAAAARTLTRRLEPDDMSWQLEKPANSPIRPLTDESGYLSMLKQLRTHKVKVINIRHPAVKEDVQPCGVRKILLVTTDHPLTQAVQLGCLRGPV